MYDYTVLVEEIRRIFKIGHSESSESKFDLILLNYSGVIPDVIETKQTVLFIIEPGTFQILNFLCLIHLDAS